MQEEMSNIYNSHYPRIYDSVTEVDPVVCKTCLSGNNLANNVAKLESARHDDHSALLPVRIVDA